MSNHLIGNSSIDSIGQIWIGYSIDLVKEIMKAMDESENFIIEKSKSKKKIEVIISLFASFTFFFYAPFEMYILNRNEMLIELKTFWFIPFCACMVSMCVLFLFLSLVPSKYTDKSLAILFSIGFLVYIQGNFLNYNFGVLNGGELDWSNNYYKWSVVNDFLVWGIGFYLSYYFAIKKQKVRILTYVSMFIVLIEVFSLAVLAMPLIKEYAEDNSEKTMIQTEKYLYELGEQDNIVVFILDMFDERYFENVLAEYPEVKEKLDGFTHFSNYTGCYSTTQNSTYLLFNGELFLNKYPIKEQKEMAAQKRMYLDEALDEGYNLNVYSCCWYNLPNRILKRTSNFEYGKKKVSGYASFARLYICLYLA